jgi:hypothetical protein
MTTDSAAANHDPTAHDEHADALWSALEHDVAEPWNHGGISRATWWPESAGAP